MNGETMEINATDVGTMSEIGIAGAEMPGMEDFYNKHYVRVDERYRVLMGYSDEFVPPPANAGETDILINDKGGRHFRLIIDGEPTEENPWWLMCNEQNVPLLKWDAKNKETVRRAEKEILADLEAQMPPLGERQKEAVARTHAMLAEALQNPIEFGGRRYTVTLEKQGLLSSLLGLYGLNAQAGIPTELSWNAAGEMCEPWTFEGLLALSNAMASHVKPLAQMQREAEAMINRAGSEKEVQDELGKYEKNLLAAVGA